jgi:prepilin-type N-terminal cleavage/methylation domain-containing protein
MKALSRQHSQAGGFSLVELLVVAAIMLILSTMMLSFGSGRRQRSQKVLCQDNLQKIYIALQIYAKDFKGELPLSTNAVTAEEPLGVLVPRYSSDTAIFTCPGGRDSIPPSGAPLTQGKISYAYYMGERLEEQAPGPQVLMSDRQINTNSKAMGEQVFSLTGKSPGNNHHKFGGNFLLGDGSAQGSTPMAPFSLTVNPGVLLLNPKP